MDTTPNIEVQNIVASVDLNTELDLVELGTLLDEAEYNPDSFPALIVKLKEPKVSFLVFRNGKINCTGAKSVEMAEEGVAELVRRLKAVGIEIETTPEIIVTNVVATVDLGVTLNLDEIALNIENIEYEPEQFPGLVYKPYGSRISVLVFGTGKLVLAGMKHSSDAIGIVNGLMQRLTDLGLM
jgi:transcription initiation factor TFIID TATA-box-binding protein